MTSSPVSCTTPVLGEVKVNDEIMTISLVRSKKRKFLIAFEEAHEYVKSCEKYEDLFKVNKHSALISHRFNYFEALWELHHPQKE